MKALFLLLCCFFFSILHSQNVGIGTGTPLSKLHISGGILSEGTAGSTPVSGAGTRMMWIPAKAAFRAGITNSSSWNDANIGQQSFAVGNNTLASGQYAIAMGSSTTASGFGSMAIGVLTIASNNYGTAMGFSTTASGWMSTAMGNQTKSKSFGGLVIGIYNDSTNSASDFSPDPLNRIFQVGNGTADNARSNAMTVLQNGNTGIGTVNPLSKLHINGAVLADGIVGSTPVSGAGTRMMWIPAKAAFRAGSISNTQWNDINIGQYSFAVGNNTQANGNSSMAIGEGATASGNYSSAIGNADATGDYSIAFGYGAASSGFSSTAIGENTSATAIYSTAIGFGTTASGARSTATGNQTSASGFYSTAMGNQTSASGNSSTALGNISSASGENSIAMGDNTSASGSVSTAMGYFTKSKSLGGFTAGIYNDSTNAASPTSINSLNRIFQIGNGTSDNARSNALTVLQNGNTGIGEVNPSVPLNFTSITGNKIALWGNGVNHYGLGIQASLLQVYSMDVNSDIAFGYGNSTVFTEGMRIKGNGNVGIGIINPAYMLTVKNDIDLDNGDANAGTIANTLKFGGGSTGEAIGSNRTTATNQFGLDFYTNSINRMAITLGGNLGIGTTAPTAKLSVNGTANNSTGNWGVFSDARIKTVSTDFMDGLSVIRQLHPVKFKYNENAPYQSDDEQIGIVAQELEKIAPYMVSKQSYQQLTDLREVNNQAYVFLLINAVKEQQIQMDKQQQLIETLMVEVQNLKRK